MDQRAKTIGFIFDFNKNWFGGINYILNLINSFNYLDQDQKPRVVVFYNQQNLVFKDEVTYPFVQWIEIKYSFNKGVTYFLSMLLRRNLFYKKEMSKCDILFPTNDLPVKFDKSIHSISWIPDFQHKILKNNFSFLHRFLREVKFKLILKNSKKTILSSQDSKNTLSKFYKTSLSKIQIVPFVSIIDKSDFNTSILANLKLVEGKYFLVSNQFHAHKNFEIVLKAFSMLPKNRKLKLVITGGKSDKNANYFNKIQRLSNSLNLNDRIIFTGFVSRDDVLSLMRFSISLIQPSFFEGWNTAIEDCKSLGVNVIASNIDVHIEQLGVNGVLFDPKNPNDLLDKMQNAEKIGNKQPENLRVRYSNFSNLFLDAISQ